MPTKYSPSASGALSEWKRKYGDAELDIIEGAWIGTEKKRYDFVLKYLSGNATSRGYAVHNFVDKNGARFLAFHDNERIVVPSTSESGDSTPDHTLITGDCFTCKATINRHSINNYKYGGNEPFKETVLNRLKFKAFIGRI